MSKWCTPASRGRQQCEVRVRKRARCHRFAYFESVRGNTCIEHAPESTYERRLLIEEVATGALALVPAEDRFWAQIAFAESGCWLWQGTIQNTGYGLIRVNKVQVCTHRYSYELLVGPIPEGLELDHLCRVRHCVNPTHLEAVTCQINILRGIGMGAVNAQKTHCVHGHAFDDGNTILIVNRNGHAGRRCGACWDDRRAKARKEKQSSCQKLLV